MRKRAAMYLRVSTDGQATENQRIALEEVAEKAGWQIAGVYEDAGISGAKGREKRPAFDRLCKDAARRRFDVVMVWHVDRLSRSLQDLVAFLGELHAVGVDLFLHQQGVDTTTPAGKAMFQMMGVFAEFERAIIQERIRAGIARARQNGTRSGRPIGRPRVKEETLERVRAALAKGHSLRQAVNETGISMGTAARVRKELSASEAVAMG